MVKKNLIEAGEFDQIEAKVREAAQIVRDVHEGRL